LKNFIGSNEGDELEGDQVRNQEVLLSCSVSTLCLLKLGTLREKSCGTETAGFTDVF
jgi:hypothetical protein